MAVEKDAEVQFKRLRGLQDLLAKAEANIQKFPFNEDIYTRLVEDFGGRKQVKKMKLLEEVQRSLFVAQLTDNKEALAWIEKLLVQLLGYYEISVRDQAVVLLNMLYDDVDWQLQCAFKPVIRCVGQHFKIDVLVDFDERKNKDAQLFLGLSAPSTINDHK